MSNIIFFHLLVLIIFLFLINYITSTPCSDNPNPSYGIITTNDDLLILNSIKAKKELRIYSKKQI